MVLSPFALLSWPTAWKAIISLSTLLYLGGIALLARLLPGTWSDPHKPAFLAFSLLFAPTLSAMHTSNVTGLSASLLLFAVYLLLSPARNNRSSAVPHENQYSQITALSIAVLLALSLSIKPTLAPVTLLYLIAIRLWKILFATLTTTAFITAIFFTLRPPSEWLASLLGNIDFLFHSGVANLAEQNLTRSDRIDLQLPIYAMTHSRNAASVVAAIVTLVLMSLWIRTSQELSVQPLSSSGNSTLLDLRLLMLSTLLVIGLLPFYQRFYSGMILLLPATWALRNLSQPRARWVLASCCVFLANTSVLPRRLGIGTRASGSSLQIILDTLFTPHLCWLLLALSLLLLKALDFNSVTLSRPRARPVHQTPDRQS